MVARLTNILMPEIPMGISDCLFVFVFFFFFRDHRRRPQHRTENPHRLENSELTMTQAWDSFWKIHTGAKPCWSYDWVAKAIRSGSSKRGQSAVGPHNWVYASITSTTLLLPMYTLLLHWNDGRVLALLQHPMCVGSFRIFTAWGGGGGCPKLLVSSLFYWLLSFAQSEISPAALLSDSCLHLHLIGLVLSKCHYCRFTTRYISGIPIWLPLNRVQSWRMCPMHL